MRACWREGIVPLLQLHDCLDCSVSSYEQAELVARLGCEAVKLDVPMRVDLKFGYNWGDAKHGWAELQPQVPQPQPITPADIEEREGIEPFSSSTATHKILCPFHDDHNPSLQIYSDGHFHCFSCGAHGDVEDLPEAASTPPPTSGATDERKLERGLQLWDTANSITGTLAERYLIEIRKLDLAIIPDLNEVLRFHPRCPFNGAHYPCVIALFRDTITNEVAGIHRIALTPDAEKIGRMMLGSWASSRAIKLRPSGTELTAGEGIETTLSGGTLTQQTALWALGSASAIGNLPLIPGIAKLIILVDHDAVGIGEARRCADRWLSANRAVDFLIPCRAGADFNDILKESGR
jgi:hypothetical protein